jgi:hypothetical protein
LLLGNCRAIILSGNFRLPLALDFCIVSFPMKTQYTESSPLFYCFETV